MSGLSVRIEKALGDFRLDAAFEAAPRGVTALFGASGAGKSTVLAALAGALRPDRGRIALGDRVLFDAGLSVINWPEKYGGRDAPLLHWVVYEEEYFAAGAPGRASANGISMLAPTLREQ